MKKKPIKQQKPKPSAKKTVVKAKPKVEAPDPIQAAIEKAFGSLISKMGLDQAPVLVQPPAPRKLAPLPESTRRQLDRAESQLFVPMTETSDTPDLSDAHDWSNTGQTENDVPMTPDNVSAMLETLRSQMNLMVNKYKVLESRIGGCEAVLKVSHRSGMSTGGM
jgi:hypothetical protein